MWIFSRGMMLDWPRMSAYAVMGLLFGSAMCIALRALSARLVAAPAPGPQAPICLSKNFFFVSVVAGNMVGFSLIVGAFRDSGDFAAFRALLGFAMFLFGTIVFLMLIYRMWEAIQDGTARTSARGAVGFLFLPLYNIYWQFQVFWGFAKDFNSYRHRHNLQAPALPTGLFLTFCILSLFTVIPLIGFLIAVPVLFLQAIMTAKICDAINAIPAATVASPSSSS